MTIARTAGDVLEDHSCHDVMFLERETPFQFAASVEHLCRRAIPRLLQTTPAEELMHFITGATSHKDWSGKQTRPSEPSSSSAGPEAPAVARQAALPLEEVMPLPDADREIEIWRDAWESLSPRDALVRRLRREPRHSDIRGVVDSLGQRTVHPTVLEAATLMKYGASQRSARLSHRPVVSGRLMDRFQTGSIPCLRCTQKGLCC